MVFFFNNGFGGKRAEIYSKISFFLVGSICGILDLERLSLDVIEIPLSQIGSSSIDLDPNNKTREMTNAFSSHNHLKKVLNDKVFSSWTCDQFQLKFQRGK